ATSPPCATATCARRSPACAPRRSGATAPCSTTSSSRPATACCTCATRPRRRRPRRWPSPARWWTGSADRRARAPAMAAVVTAAQPAVGAVAPNLEQLVEGGVRQPRIDAEPEELLGDEVGLLERADGAMGHVGVGGLADQGSREQNGGGHT